MLRRASLLLNGSSDAPRNAGSQRSSPRFEAQAAFFTLPARMHAVQIRTCFLTPATTARTRFKFGFHRRRRVLFAWLITFPKCGPLPQNSHFSAIFLPASVFIWAWISRSKCRQTKLLILADPPPPAKCGLCIPKDSSGHAFCAPNGFTGYGVCLRKTLRVDLLHPMSPRPPLARLFFRTGFDCAPRTSNCSNHIEITRVVRKRNARWPRVPLLA